LYNKTTRRYKGSETNNNTSPYAAEMRRGGERQGMVLHGLAS